MGQVIILIFMAQIRCVVERVTCQNPENGYSVFRVKVKGYDDLGSRYGLQGNVVKDDRFLPASIGSQKSEQFQRRPLRGISPPE